MAWRSESLKPRPMTCLAVSRSGTGSAMSRAACWIPSAITAAESNNVPSQSNTINGYRLGIQARKIGAAELQHVPGKRRLERDARAFDRMLERQPARMQEQALHALPRERAVEFEIAVLVIAEDGMPGVREVHADLVRAAGHETQLDQAEV